MNVQRIVRGHKLEKIAISPYTEKIAISCETSMHSYFAFGIKISSTILLPELIATPFSGQPDVTISTDTSPNAFNVRESVIQPNHSELCIDSVAHYTVSQGQRIHIIPAPNASLADINLFLLGSVMGLILQQRGCLLLHCCALEHRGRAYLFAAHSGLGKSTLAYGLYQRGYRVLTDDVACITRDSGCLVIHPGYPRLRLTAASAQALAVDVSDAPVVTTCDEKYLLQCHDQWQTSPLPVAHFCVIEPDVSEQIKVAPATRAIKLIKLKEHSYRVEFLLKQQLLGAHFNQVSAFAQNVSMSLLKRPEDGFDIAALLQQAEQHMQITSQSLDAATPLPI